jgi:DNA end-binding protein Ku
MAARPTWKGHMKISLVSIPVRVFPATDAQSSISFNQLHAVCQTRIQQKKWCPNCEREVSNAELAKGYEFEKGRYVVMSDEDVAKAKPASTRVIDLVQFVSAEELDPIYFERPYYLAPDGDVAGSAFAVMRDGMAGKVGIGKLALYGREYLVAVQPKERGFVMFTMRQASEVRAMTEITELERVPESIKAQEAKLARQVIETFESPLDLKDYKDEYQAELRRIIDAKVAGQEVTATEEEAPAKVVDLMEALRRSLDSVSAGKKTQARASLPKAKAARGKKAEEATAAEAEAEAPAKAPRRRKAS